jgi:hypothetical protein
MIAITSKLKHTQNSIRNAVAPFLLYEFRNLTTRSPIKLINPQNPPTQNRCKTHKKPTTARDRTNTHTQIKLQRDKTLKDATRNSPQRGTPSKLHSPRTQSISSNKQRRILLTGKKTHLHRKKKIRDKNSSCGGNLDNRAVRWMRAEEKTLDWEL